MIGSTRLHAILALLVFLASGLFVATHIENAIDTDILSLLPGDARDPVLADALQRASAVASDRVAFSIEGGTRERRREAAAELVAALASTGLFQPSSTDAESLWKWLFAHRASLLCDDDRQRLIAGQGNAIASESLRQWYAPMGLGSSGLLKTDPLLLTGRLLTCLVPAGIRTLPDPTVEIVSGSIGTSVYRLDVQDRINAVVDAWRHRPETKGLTLSRAGAVFHAAYGAEQARTEMSVIGGITTVAVLLLYWLMFRSLRAPLIAMTMVLYSLTIGLAFTIAAFGSVHAMALVFGAALIGMVVDYTTYYLITGFDGDLRTVVERKAQIHKPLTLGMLTSVGAFAALMLFPVPAFRQIAVLGSVGLLAAWIGTLVLTPLAEGGHQRLGPGAVGIERTAGRALARTPRRCTAWAVLAVCVLLASVSVVHGRVLDDVRRFQAPSPELAAEEARVKTLTGFATSGTFFLVRAPSADAAVVAEEALLMRLEQQGSTSSVVWASSRFSPSDGRQEEDRRLIAERLVGPFLTGLVEKLGAGSVQAYSSATGANTTGNLPDFAAALRGKTDGTYWSIVPLAGRVPPIDGSNWQLVDPAARYSDLIAKYRWRATGGLAAAVASTGLLLILAYRRLSAIKIMLPMVMALVVTPALTMFLGLPFSFFSAMGLFLVVGAGVDYGIFQWERPSEEGKWTRVGIVLAALMTCISVGLLGLSSVLPVRSFGVTVAIGILLSVLLSPLVRKWD